MKIMIDLTSLIMMLVVVFLIYVIVDMMKTDKKPANPVIVRDVEIYDYPTWYGWDLWPWNWNTRSGSYGNAWFGPGKPCRGWQCEGEHNKPRHVPGPVPGPGPAPGPMPGPGPGPAPGPMPGPGPQPIPEPMPTPITMPSQEPIQVPIQDMPIQPVTAERDMQVALAPTAETIKPETTNISTATV